MSTSIQITSSYAGFTALGWNIVVYKVSEGLHQFREAIFIWGRKAKALWFEELPIIEKYERYEFDFKEKQKFPLNFERPKIKHQVIDRRPKLVKIIYR